MRLPHFAGALGAAILLSPVALAHVGFINVVADDLNGSGQVTLEASFSDTFPNSEIALKSEAWTVVAPDGSELEFDRVGGSSLRSVLQVTVAGEGTYRFSSGERLGRGGEVARVDEDFVLLGTDGLSKDNLPDGAEVLASQTATVSDIYLTRGAADDGVLDSRIGRLAIVPESNPTVLSAGDALTVTFTFDGEPLAGKAVAVFSPTSSREENTPDTLRMTDEEGRLTTVFEAPGEHLFVVRQIALSPEGAETPARSYSTFLTVRVD